MSSIFRVCYLVILILLAGCTSKPTKPITVLSYNIHHGAGMDTILDLERIARVINSVSPDIVALQEVDINTERNGNINQMEVLGKLTNMNFVFGKSMDFNDGQYGNGILTKFPVKSHKVHPLPGEEPRSALAAIIKIEEETEIVLISTHLSTQEKNRLESLQPIEDILKDYKQLPLIFAGDLNAVPESQVLSGLSKNLNNATIDQKTTPVDMPMRQIDYIMFTPKDRWSVVSSRVLDEKIASDHRPIMSILKPN